LSGRWCIATHPTAFGRYGHAYLDDLTKSLDNLPTFNKELEHHGEEMRRTPTDRKAMKIHNTKPAIQPRIMHQNGHFVKLKK
jgi:hypothetical protein